MLKIRPRHHHHHLPSSRQWIKKLLSLGTCKRLSLFSLHSRPSLHSHHTHGEDTSPLTYKDDILPPLLQHTAHPPTYFCSFLTPSLSSNSHLPHPTNPPQSLPPPPPVCCCEVFCNPAVRGNEMFTWASIGIFQPAATPGSRDPTRDFHRVGIPESVLLGECFCFFAFFFFLWQRSSCLPRSKRLCPTNPSVSGVRVLEGHCGHGLSLLSKQP